ncbi:MAG: O-antigen ligase family protein [Chloroflexi bacterium]|nr:O-antigen ligase family protein [Chloroflexota bacterium]
MPALAALAGGLALGALPLRYGAALLLGAGLLLAALRQPLVGLALTLLVAPTKAYLAAALPGLPADWGQAALALTLAVWLVRAAYRRELRLSFPAPLLALLGYAFVGALSLTRAADLTAGLGQLVKWLEVALVALLVVEQARAGHAGWILAGALLAGSAQAAIGLWQFGLRGAGPQGFAILGSHFRAYGTFEQPNPYAGYLGLIWPLAAGLALGLAAEWFHERLEIREWRLQSLIPNLQSLISPLHSPLPPAAVALAALAGLGVSFSRGAWLGAGAAVGAMILFGTRKWWAGGLLVAGGLAGIGFLSGSGLLPGVIADRLRDVGTFVQVYDVRGANITDENFALVERVAHWQAALEMARQHPWLGVGLDNYEAAYPGVRLLNWVYPLGHAHNIYLNALAETGALGLAAYLTLWGTVFAFTIRGLRARGWRRGLALGLLGAFTHLSVHNLVDNLYVNNTHLLVGVLLGLSLWLAATDPPAPVMEVPPPG